MDVDTIASVSTAPGVGAIAVVRISGPGATDVLRSVAPALTAPPEPRSVTVVELADPVDGEPLDRALATFFPGPASYTGEDLVELSCHGGWLVPELVLDACLRAGARRAEPGEFTRRAYLRGKLDLIQVEAVADLIDARSRALHRAALGQLERGLSDRLSGLRQDLVRLEALLAHHIDFPEEDEAPVSLEAVAREADRLVGALDGMLATAPEGELLREGALTVLAGRPNAGKSSLYNALIGQERAIVTEEPGTTRDALEATVQLGGFPFRLVDTAGLREEAETVERIGIEVARGYVDRADLILLCIPTTEGAAPEDARFLEGVTTPVVIVETKADLAPEAGGDRAGAARAGPPMMGEGSGASGGGGPASLGGAGGARVGMRGREGASGVVGRLRVSTRTGQGLDQVRQLLPELVYASVVTAEPTAPIVTRRRHAEALERARSEIDAFRAGLRDGLPAEVAASHLRPAETALEELLGVVSVDDVLDVVFREFCIGK